jgi:hypothetical protein
MVMAKEPQQKSGGGLSIQTLLISACAAVAAATIVPMLWEQGTIIATAMTPVVVALVSEGLRKPVQQVSAVAPKVTRRSGTGAAMRRFDPAAAETRSPERVGARGDGPERFEPLPPHLRSDAPSVRDDDPYGLRKASKTPRPRLKIALITGALAFFIAAGVVTASELAVFGGSVSSDRRTSLFGGQKSSSTTKSGEDKADEEATPTATPKDGEATPTPTPTATPQGAAPQSQSTPPPSPSATPTPVQPNVTITPVPTP